MASSLDDLVPTLSSRIRNQSKSSTPPVVEVVEFKAYKRKSKALEDDPADDQLTAKKKDEVVDMKKARFEIMKFGMNRMTGREKEKTKDIIAIELGAKPPKNKYVNYKTLQETRKREKVQQREEKKLFEINRKTIGKKSVKKINRNDVIKKKMSKKMNKGGGSGIIGKYGKPTLSVPKNK
ncbi:hypothetical protein M8J76_003434 [Diaphorina citri]|nr:hypothetical protein M8J76_003434 [Diaphorina citri]